MKIYSDTKVYVECPANTASGGPELLHQLVSQLIKLNIDAYVFYLPQNTPNPTPSEYKKYHVPFTRYIEDAPHNVLIVPETAGELIYRFKKIQRVFWWLSVDNYVTNVINYLNDVKNVGFLVPVPRCFHFHATNSDDIEHWLQSEYARRFCLINGVPESRLKTVRDYVNSNFLLRAAHIDNAAKQNIIAFNPKKGFEFTRKLIQAAPDLVWARIQNMSPEQVRELLVHSKIYIDFGNHPGRDRIPREAAVSNCVIITGRRGAAANPIDIAIDDEFKFEDSDENIPRIVERIKEILADFPTAFEKQQTYREEIMREPETFAREVEAACDFVEPRARFQHAAALQDITDEKNLPAFGGMTRTMSHLKLSCVVDNDKYGGLSSGSSRASNRRAKNFCGLTRFRSSRSETPRFCIARGASINSSFTSRAKRRKFFCGRRN